MVSTEHFNIRGVFPVLMVFPRWLPSGDICRNELKYSRFLAGKCLLQVESSHPDVSELSILTMLSNSSYFFAGKISGVFGTSPE